MSYTIKKLNALAQKDGLELVKGKGYFYWLTLDGGCPIGTVATPHFNRLPERWWLVELEEAVKQYKRGY